MKMNVRYKPAEDRVRKTKPLIETVMEYIIIDGIKSCRNIKSMRAGTFTLSMENFM